MKVDFKFKPADFREMFEEYFGADLFFSEEFFLDLASDANARVHAMNLLEDD